MAQTISGKTTNVQEASGLASKEVTVHVSSTRTHLHTAALLVDVDGNVIKATRTRENLAGSAGSGSSGDSGRVYTLTTSSDVDIVEVYLDGVLLVETTNYTIDNSAKTVTFVGAVFDSQTVTVFYNV